MRKTLFYWPCIRSQIDLPMRRIKHLQRLQPSIQTYLLATKQVDRLAQAEVKLTVARQAKKQRALPTPASHQRDFKSEYS